MAGEWFGSFLADAGIACLRGPHSLAARLLFIEMEMANYSLTKGAVEDLITTSEPIQKMNSVKIILPCHAIAGDYRVTIVPIVPYIEPWDGNVDPEDVGHLIVYGIYSDGIERRVSNADLTFVSADSSIASVDSEGNVRPHKLGESVITVSSGEIGTTASVSVRYPRGLRPSETIPTITSIDIQPPANSAGWHSTDITITLAARDNEGGSGIQEIDWRFAGKAKEDYVYGDSAVIAYDVEGVKKFSYWSRDKEGNEDDNKVGLRLDKTPPDITLTLSPIKLSEEDDEEGSWYELSYSATDTLSGLKSLVAGLIIPPVSNLNQELKVHKELEIRIDEEKKELKIESPNPQDIFTQLQHGLLTFNSAQALQLKLKQGDPKWKLKEKQQGLEIQASSIIFKVIASDIADNTITKELEFKTGF